MKNKLAKLFLSLLLVFGIGLAVKSQSAQAAAYGAKLYTTPKRLRGTWHFKKGKNFPYAGTSRKYLNPYKKIRITKHTVTFTRFAGKKALSGRYTLYKAPNSRHWSLKKVSRAEKYAEKHRWLNPYNMTHKSFAFSKFWLHFYQSTSDGEFKRSGSGMIFHNAFYRDTFGK